MENIKLDNKNVPNKAYTFVKDNILILALFVLSVVYIGYGIVNIEKSGKTILEILADAIINLLWGMSFNVLMSRIGTKYALNNASYINTMEVYGDELEETTPNIEKLDYYCDNYNAEDLKRRQSKILFRERLSYDDFINERYCYIKLIKQEGKLVPREPIPEGMINLSKRKWKCVKRANKIKFYGISADNLMSEMTDEEEQRGKREPTINQYLRKSDRKDFISKIIFAVVSAYITMKFVYSTQALVEAIIMVGTWIALGLTSAIKKYSYILNEYRNKIIRKSNHLHKFNNIMKTNSNKYEVIINECSREIQTNGE